MTTSDASAAGRADELRRAFDRSFAEPPSEHVARFEDFLAITVGGDAFAIRLGEVAGLFADKAITPVPSAVAELVGVAGFRGAIVPVYDLRALLGYRTSEPSRWLVLVAAKGAPVALAFDHFEGQLRVPPEAVANDEKVGERAGRAREVIRVAGGTRSIVNISSVLEAVTRCAQQQGIVQRER
jgi:chemotaxis signal transduction protein